MSGFTHEAPVNQTCEWYTPRWVFDLLGLRFDLDPCHPADRLPWVPADRTLCQADDGLSQPWAGRVWLNPPYGAETVKWVAKQHQHFTAREATGVGLLFARTDTAWFHDYVAQADGLLFLRRRVRFVDRNEQAGGSPGAGSMLIAWGAAERRALIRAEAEGFGKYVDTAF